MLAAKYPVAGDQKLRPKSGRRPLQPKNFQANPIVDSARPKPKKERVEVSPVSGQGELNKEKHRVLAASTTIGSFDASLAEELSAIRKRLERLRVDRERTEKMLKEKDDIFDLQMKELEERAEIQKKLEIEVDRLYRLNQLHSQSLRFSPIRSLREKLSAKKAPESESQELENEVREESVGENALQEIISPASPEIVQEKK
ncbi:hypothetical protein PanWU01x14_364080 [Parasponia andersonii]|uniref:Uncharacterized protein n=1 Tax=Parasponia andersonii TaxID=3476 RepID=A0A2P5A6D4_PARAD|nr:hypothetical protein PanWU01x14_364080 [Parasponia andersonii]